MDRKPTYEELKHRLEELEKEAIERKQEQEILRESEKKFREYVETMNEGLGVTDENYLFTYVNEKFSNLLGYSREEMLGRHITEFVAEDYQRVINEEISQRKRGEATSYELVWNSKDGRRVYTLLSPKGIFDSEGVFKGSFGVLTDVTALKQVEKRLRESEDRYRDLYENAPNAYFSISAEDGSILRCNTAALRLLGYEEETMLKMKVFDLYADTHYAKAQELFKGFKTGESLKDVELQLKHKDGHAIWISLSVEPVKDSAGKVIESRSMAVDITDRKLAEEAIKRSSEKIKLFAYSVSHDLKSPAIGIYGVTKILHEHYRDVLDERGKNYCDQILKGSEHIAALVEKINEEYATQLEIRQISWSEPEHVKEINGDRLSILRVFRNLIDNALKYGGDDLSDIKIGYKETDQFHILCVEDDGVGITEEDSKKVFGLFKRPVTSRGIEGAGLGLAIVKETAERHEGNVWVEPGQKRGITFYISLSKYLQQTR
jgi:PAS domain S-box-containing protein